MALGQIIIYHISQSQLYLIVYSLVDYAHILIELSLFNFNTVQGIF